MRRGPAVKLQIVLSIVEPARLVLKRQPFSHPDWLFELKYDGFRSLAYFGDNVRLVSRNGHIYKRFPSLCESLASLNLNDEVLDGEIVCLDDHGRTRFYDLMFRRGEPRYAAFDILWHNCKDLRSLPLSKRKQTLRKLIPAEHSHALYVDHIEENGVDLFDMICGLDMEGVVAKLKTSPYAHDSWQKIKNPNYTQLQDRHEVFDRKREPLFRSSIAQST